MSDNDLHCISVTLSYFKLFANLLEKLSFAFFDPSAVEYHIFTSCSFLWSVARECAFPISLINHQDYFVLMLAYRGQDVCWNCVKGMD